MVRFVNSRVLKKWGSLEVRSRIWNNEFAAGHWSYIDSTVGDPIYGLIEKYASEGTILDVGCGTGNTGIELKTEKYSAYRGIDISQTAIDKAISRSRGAGRTDTNLYACADMLSYVPDEKYDLIVFRECLWYVRKSQALSMLRRYSGYLREHGKLLASICPVAQQKWLGPLIERDFRLVEKFHEKKRGLIVVFQ
jgi:SAM-dependent methyltransferase